MTPLGCIFGLIIICTSIRFILLKSTLKFMEVELYFHSSYSEMIHLLMEIFSVVPLLDEFSHRLLKLQGGLSTQLVRMCLYGVEISLACPLRHQSSNPF